MAIDVKRRRFRCDYMDRTRGIEGATGDSVCGVNGFRSKESR